MKTNQTSGNSFDNLPVWLLQKWQKIADLLADLLEVRAALIMKTEDEFMEVFISSHSQGNPYHVGEKEKWYGLYCETVIKTQKILSIPDATQDPVWDHNPDIKLGMIAYLGFPINLPNNEPFGTLCVLDNKERHFSAQQEKLLSQLKDVIELDLVIHQSLEIKSDQLSKIITEHQQAEEKMRASEAMYRRIIETAYEGVWIIDAESKTSFVNQRMSEIIGYSTEEMIGASLFDFMDDQGKIIAAEDVERRRKGIKEQHDFKFRRKDGSDLWAIVETNPIFDSEGNYQGALGMISDITERKHAEDRNRIDLAEKEMLLRELNHRTKNNLNIISSLISLQAKNTDNEVFRSLAQTLQTRIESIAMVHELLYRSPNLAMIDLKEYTSQLVAHLTDGFSPPAQNIEIRMDAMPVQVPINTAIPCGQILNELLFNAFKYAFPDGRRGYIAIHLSKDGKGEITIRVEDNGVGFPAGYDDKKASSLGLPLIRMLVRQLGGVLNLNTSDGVACEIRFQDSHNQQS